MERQFILELIEANSIIGLNYIVCSDLKLNFNENEIENIVFYRNPKAKMIPPMRLKDRLIFKIF